MMTFGIVLNLLFTVFLPTVLPAAEAFPARLPTPTNRLLVLPTTVSTPPHVSAAAVEVWDPYSHQVLYSQHADVALPIASVTKLMTVYVALQHGLDLDGEITIQTEDNDPAGSRLDLPTGAVVGVRDLLIGTLVGSANNGAEALVRATGMGEAEFVAAMNATAADLGMTSTHFTDVTGLGPKNVASARDVVLLATAAFGYDEVREATTRATFELTDRRTGRVYTAKNTDDLVGTDLRVLAGKTGYTDAAGGCLVSSIQGIGNRDLTIVVLGSTRTGRFTDTRALADWAFAYTTWQ